MPLSLIRCLKSFGIWWKVFCYSGSPSPQQGSKASPSSW